MRLYAKFRKTTKYQLWIAYISTEESEIWVENEKENPVLGYYCMCKSGARTIGTVTSILWFLEYAKYQADIRYPSMNLVDEIKDAGSR